MDNPNVVTPWAALCGNSRDDGPHGFDGEPMARWVKLAKAAIING